MPIRRRLLPILLIPIVLGAAGVWRLGSQLVAVEPHAVALPPGLGAETLVLDAGPGQRVAASFVPAAATPKGGVLLLHGIHGDRRQMAARAAFLHLSLIHI